MNPEEMACQHCDEIGGVHWVSRAKWVCETCGTDNSLAFVFFADAIEKEENDEPYE